MCRGVEAAAATPRDMGARRGLGCLLLLAGGLGCLLLSTSRALLALEPPHDDRRSIARRDHRRLRLGAMFDAVFLGSGRCAFSRPKEKNDEGEGHHSRQRRAYRPIAKHVLPAPATGPGRGIVFARP